jgi:hypothetical protein
VLQGLDRLRDFVHQRLDWIESLAQERAAAGPADPSERENELRRRLVELEDRYARVVAEAKRKEREWESGLETLENDRRLIAEAWDRLERERVDGAVGTPGQPAPRPASGSVPPRNNPGAPPKSFRPAVTPESNDVITHAILRQFQALRSDVRRNANGR